MLKYLQCTNIHPAKTSFCYKEEISLFFRLFSSLFSSSSFSSSHVLPTRLSSIRAFTESSLSPLSFLLPVCLTKGGNTFCLRSALIRSLLVFTLTLPLTPLESVHGAIDPLLCFPLSSHQQQHPSIHCRLREYTPPLSHILSSLPLGLFDIPNLIYVLINPQLYTK